MPDFRTQIETAMKRRGWNQTQLADAAGMRRSHVSRYLGKKVGITERNLSKLLDALKGARK